MDKIIYKRAEDIMNELRTINQHIFSLKAMIKSGEVCEMNIKYTRRGNGQSGIIHGFIYDNTLQPFECQEAIKAMLVAILKEKKARKDELEQRLDSL